MPLLFNYKFNFSSCYPTFLSTIVDKQRGSIRLFNEKSRRYNFILIKSCQTFTITRSYAIYVGQQVSSSVLLLNELFSDKFYQSYQFRYGILYKRWCIDKGKRSVKNETRAKWYYFFNYFKILNFDYVCIYLFIIYLLYIFYISRNI